MTAGGALGEPGAKTSEGRIIATLVTLLTLGLVDAQLLSPILPMIAESFGVEETSIGSTLAGYGLAAALSALVIGPMSDRFGRGRFLVGAGGLFSLASLLVVAAGSFWEFVLARILMGGAAGIISALSVAAIADHVPYERRGRAMGWVAMAYVAAPVLCVPIAAVIAGRVGWRTNYLIFTFAAAVVAVVIARWFEESSNGSEWRSAGYLRFFGSVSTAAGALSGFFVSGGFVGFMIFLGAYLQSRFQLTINQVALVFTLAGLASVLGALGAGRVADRIGKIRVALAGSASLAFFLLVVPETTGFVFYVTLGLVGLSAASRVAPLQSIITQLVDRKERGAYVALRNALSQSGQGAAGAIAALVYDHGFQYVCWMAAGFSAVAVVLILFIDEPEAPTE